MLLTESMGRYHPHKITGIVVVWYMVIVVFCWCSRGSGLHCMDNERQALLNFKHSLSDPSSRLSSWVGEECCNWTGVQCDSRTKHIIKLDLRNPHSINWTVFEQNNRHDPVYTKSCLVGQEVHPSLIHLKHLQYLDLSWNNFSGTPIPNFFGSYRELRYLRLSSTFFSGIVPHQLGNLSTLRLLDLSNAFYIYNFPLSHLRVDNLHWIRGMSYLEYLDMSYVSLQQIPNALQTINSLSRLLELHLSNCVLIQNSSDISNFNLTSLVIFDLSENYLQGPLPNYLANMTSLQVLDLSNNNFSGTIQSDLSHLCNLESLDFSKNSLRGEILKLFENSSSNCPNDKRLEELGLELNQFSGYLPNWLDQFMNLNYLVLGDNNFRGEIPPTLWKLSSLRDLSLNANKFNGSIPEFLGQLSNLEGLDLSSNSFEGVISDVHFSKLSNLKSLNLGFNSLILKIRPSWVPPFQLQTIDLSSSEMGSEFPIWLRTQKELSLIRIFNASIDSVPEWFFDFSNHSSQVPMLSIDLSFNQLHGKVPRIFNSRSSRKMFLDLDLSQNKFEGPFPHFPSNVVRIDLSHNLISGPIPEAIGDMLPQLKALVLIDNLINGSMPQSFCRMKFLFHLDLSMNNLSGGLPRCWSNLQTLLVLHLSSNNISGTIPDSIGNLVLLQSLHLSRNNLHGQIPLSLKNCIWLVTLDLGENKLSGNIPTWIGENLPQLKMLRLRLNKFNGIIPLQLCHLTLLQLLDLAQNNISGTIPPCFGDLTGMILDQSLDNWYRFMYTDQLKANIKGRESEYTKNLPLVSSLDLSSNTLVGTIPKELTTLASLKALNLSENQLGGSIPENMGNMTSLESLDLSENQLSGKIPGSISALNFLSHLNLSHNKLSGKIPSGNQLQTLDDPSIYNSNLDLCGAPLERKCAGEEPAQPPTIIDSMHKNEEDESERTWFYIGMASGHVVGFWGVCGALFFKKSWRVAYFRFLTGIKDWLLGMVAVKIAQLKRKLKRNQVEG